MLGPVVPLTAAGAAAVGLIARRAFGARKALLPAWRACTLAAVAAGAVITLLLVPRSGWVHALVAIDRASGRVLWVQEGIRAPRTAVHRANSQATPTAVTDGERVFAYFGTPGVLAVNGAGSVLWTNTSVPFETIYGAGASPILAPQALLVSGFNAATPYLAALDPASGRERWRAARPVVHPEFGDSRTPPIVTHRRPPDAVIWGVDELAGYDVDTGKVLWRYTHGANQRMGSMVTSMVVDGDMLLLPLENGMFALSAATTAGRTGPCYVDEPRWRQRPDHARRVRGAVSLRSPPRVWRLPPTPEPGSCSGARGSRASITRRPSPSPAKSTSPTRRERPRSSRRRPKFEVLGQNDIGEPVVATIAPVDGDLYIRSHHHLFASDLLDVLRCADRWSRDSSRNGRLHCRRRRGRHHPGAGADRPPVARHGAGGGRAAPRRRSQELYRGSATGQAVLRAGWLPVAVSRRFDQLLGGLVPAARCRRLRRADLDSAQRLAVREEHAGATLCCAPRRLRARDVRIRWEALATSGARSTLVPASSDGARGHGVSGRARSDSGGRYRMALERAHNISVLLHARR